ncbi:MAG TPA: hypothetical protein VLE97_06065 [Gaiellaceae bacterium]|nr:hypothetical protein [Gaiellaceae bacterium]
MSASIKISTLAKTSGTPEEAIVSWQDVVAMLSSVRRTPCTAASCSGPGCPHKNGACWSPAAFRSGYRSVASVEEIGLLVLDVDRQPEAAVLAARDHLARYAHVIHATHADRPGSRSMRVVVRLSRPVDPSEWPRFWRAAVAALRVQADPPVSDAGRCYFLPSRPADADYFVAAQDGEQIDVDAMLASPIAATSAEVQP